MTPAPPAPAHADRRSARWRARTWVTILACALAAALAVSQMTLGSSRAADMPITSERFTVQVFGGGIP